VRIQKLHEAKFVHNDLRLDNVVVYQDKVLLIDWQSLSLVGEKLETYRTAFALTPDRMIASLLSPISQRLETSMYDDLEQLAYGNISLTYGTYPWMNEVERKSTDKRFKFGSDSYRLLSNERTDFIDHLDESSVEKQFLKSSIAS
jgi:hypothetical protein